MVPEQELWLTLDHVMVAVPPACTVGGLTTMATVPIWLAVIWPLFGVVPEVPEEVELLFELVFPPVPVLALEPLEVVPEEVEPDEPEEELALPERSVRKFCTLQPVSPSSHCIFHQV